MSEVFFLRKWLILIHRYLGIALSLLFLLWFLSGIPMIYTRGMPHVTAQDRLDRLPPLDLTRVRLTPAEALEQALLGRSPTRLTLLMIMDRPAYRFGNPGEAVTVFADSGDILEEVGAAQAIAVASRFTGLPPDRLRDAGELDGPDQWTMGLRAVMPLRKIVAGDDTGIELYVSGSIGEVVMETTRRTRRLAWIAAIPHWLYFAPLRMNDLLWTRVIVWTAGLGSIAALIGLVLAVTQYRVKYRGWMRLHYVTGVVFGVFTATWAFSGLLSIEPFEWLSRGNAGGRIAPALAGRPLDVAAFPAFDAAGWSKVLEGRPAKEIEFRRVLGDPYFVVRGAEAKPMLVGASQLRIQRDGFPFDALLERVRQGYPEASVAESQVLSDYDAYYYDRDRDAPLPVLRVKFNDADATWVYVDGTSQIVGRFDRRRRIVRWLYHGFHSLDFSFWYYSRPLWDVAVITLCLGGALLSAIGVVIGFKRLKRSTRRALA